LLQIGPGAEEDEEVIDRSQSLGLQFNAASMPLR